MPLGTRLFGTLLKSNAVVTVQYAKSDPTGGTTHTWTDVATRIDVLVSQAGGGRDTANGTMMFRHTFSVAGVHPALTRPDVRLYVTAAESGLSDLVGRYLSVTDTDAHSKGSGGLRGARVNLKVQVLEAPADAGTEL